MSVLGIIAFISGTLGVWLTIKQSIFCWPMALISVVAGGIDFYFSRLYGDMSLQVFYFFAGIYGWFYWNKNKGLNFVASPVPYSWIPILIIVTLLQFSLYYYLLIYFKGARPLLDAVLTAGSLTTTFMMTKKWIENWLIWVLIDGTYIVLYALSDLWLYGALYLIFAGMAFYGWLSWKKTKLSV
ncbi:MAG: nicotinamide riboside transporter PnuC [bacterium]|nr:nicotinamide riboside transporter PnuC [bacterium]